MRVASSARGQVWRDLGVGRGHRSSARGQVWRDLGVGPRSRCVTSASVEVTMDVTGVTLASAEVTMDVTSVTAEALQQQEEREKTMLLQKAEALRRERALMKELARAEEDHLRAMAEENRHKFKEQMEKLTAEISALKMEAAGESTSQQGGIKRE
nr:putative E3 ubiquitin-protein ligase RF298 [Ipomoea batatas]